jgi:hypothetical protein
VHAIALHDGRVAEVLHPSSSHHRLGPCCHGTRHPGPAPSCTASPPPRNPVINPGSRGGVELIVQGVYCHNATQESEFSSCGCIPHPRLSPLLVQDVSCCGTHNSKEASANNPGPPHPGLRCCLQPQHRRLHVRALPARGRSRPHRHARWCGADHRDGAWHW